MDEQKMTKAEFESLVKAWAKSAKDSMKNKISKKTHGTGKLEKSLSVSVREDSKITRHTIGFRFERYGFYVAYGVGRGWISQNGTVVRGNRIKEGTDAFELLKKQGFSKTKIKKEYTPVDVMAKIQGKARKPVDWFDSVLHAEMDKLGDVAANYYGDYSAEQVLKSLDDVTMKTDKV